jgi:hypothetical protein
MCNPPRTVIVCLVTLFCVVAGSIMVGLLLPQVRPQPAAPQPPTEAPEPTGFKGVDGITTISTIVADEPPNILAVNRRAQLLAYGSYAGEITVADLVTGVVRHTFSARRGQPFFAFAPDGSRFSLFQEDSLSVYCCRTWTRLSALRTTHGDWRDIRGMACCPSSGDIYLDFAPAIVRYSVPALAVTWSCGLADHRGQQLLTLGPRPGDLVVARTPKECHAPATVEQIATSDGSTRNPHPAPACPIDGVRVSPDGDHLAFASGNKVLFAPRRSFARPASLDIGTHAEEVGFIGPGGLLYAHSSGPAFALIQASPFRLLRKIQLPVRICASSLSEDRLVLAVALENRRIQVFEIDPDVLLRTN